MTQIDGEIYHVYGLEDQNSENEYTIDSMQSVDSMQSLSSYKWHFSQKYNK